MIAKKGESTTFDFVFDSLALERKLEIFTVTIKLYREVEREN